MMEEKLIKIFVEKFNITEEVLKSNINFIESALLGSIQFVQLTMEIEEEFDIVFDTSDYVEENFISLKSICNLIKTKQGTN